MIKLPHSKKRKNAVKPFMLKIALIAISYAGLTGIASAKSSQDWTGFYVGPEVGGVFTQANLNANQLGFTNPSDSCDSSSNFSSFFPGAQLGYAWESDSRVVWGVEGNFSYNVNKTSNISCNCPVTPGVADRFSVKNRMQGAVRARLGYDVGYNILPFLIGGGSFGNMELNYSNEGGDNYSKSSTQAGWLLGCGIEWQAAHDWSISAKYFYAAYSQLNLSIPTVYGLNDPNGGARLKMNTNNVEVDFNYWFWG